MTKQPSASRLRFKGDDNRINKRNKKGSNSLKTVAHKDLSKDPLPHAAPIDEAHGTWTLASQIDQINGPVFLRVARGIQQTGGEWRVLDAGSEMADDGASIVPRLKACEFSSSNENSPRDVHNVLVVTPFATRGVWTLRNAFRRYLGASTSPHFAVEAVGAAEEWQLEPIPDTEPLQFRIASRANGLFLALPDNCQNEREEAAAEMTLVTQRSAAAIFSAFVQAMRPSQPSAKTAACSTKNAARPDALTNEELLLQRQRAKSDKFCK